MPDIKQRVYDELEKELGVTPQQIEDDKKLVEDLGCDDLDIIELIMSLEEEFEISIPDGVEDNWTTVGDVVKYLEGLDLKEG